ncbi:hypothetical protein E1295_47015, partial [Nonomuraea mesophila]
MTETEQYDANDFLMGGGIPSGHAVFDKAPHGTALTGTVTATPTVEQQRDLDTGKLKFWDSDGKPMMQLVVTLQTDLRDPEMHDDSGLRKLYVKGNMLAAIRTAVRAAGAKGLEPGGTLTVTYVSDGEQKKAGKNPPKIYTAVYVAPAAAAANAFVQGGQPGPIAQMPQQFAQTGSALAQAAAPELAGMPNPVQTAYNAAQTQPAR